MLRCDTGVRPPDFVPTGVRPPDFVPTVTTTTAWLYLVYTYPPIVGWVTPGRFKPIR